MERFNEANEYLQGAEVPDPEPDALAAIAGGVWSEIYEPSIGIWRTEEEANREYRDWYNENILPKLYGHLNQMTYYPVVPEE